MATSLYWNEDTKSFDKRTVEDGSPNSINVGSDDVDEPTADTSTTGGVSVNRFTSGDNQGSEPEPTTTTTTTSTSSSGGSLTTGSGAVTTDGAGNVLIDQNNVDGDLSSDQLSDVAETFTKTREEGLSGFQSASEETQDIINDIAAERPVTLANGDSAPTMQGDPFQWNLGVIAAIVAGLAILYGLLAGD